MITECLGWTVFLSILLDLWAHFDGFMARVTVKYPQRRHLNAIKADALALYLTLYSSFEWVQHYFIHSTSQVFDQANAKILK